MGAGKESTRKEDIEKLEKKLNILEKESLPASFSNAKKEITTALKNTAQLEKKLKEITEKSEKLDKKVSERDGLKEDLRTINRLNKELEIVKVEKIDTSKFNDKINELNKKLAELNITFIKSEEKTIKELKNKSEDFVLRDEFKRISDDVESLGELNNEILALREDSVDRAEFENKLTDVENLNSEVKNLKTNLKESKAEIKYFEKELKKTYTEVEAVLHEIKETRKKTGEQAAQLKSEISRKFDKEKLKEELDQTKRELDLEQEIKTRKLISEVHVSFEKKILDLTDDIHKLEYRASRKDETKTLFMQEISELRGLLNEQKSRINLLREEMPFDLKKDFSKFEEEVSELVKQSKKELQSRNQENSEKQSRITEELNSLLKNTEEKDRAIKDLADEIEDLRNSLSNEKARISSMKYNLPQELKKEVGGKINGLEENLRHKDAIIDALNRKVASDNSLRYELENLNKKLNEEKRFNVDRQKIELKIKEKKNEQIEGFKSMFLYVALGVMSFAVLAYFYFKGQGLMLPDIGKRLIFVIIILAILAVILFTPKNMFIKIKDSLDFSDLKKKWSKFLDFLVGKK